MANDYPAVIPAAGFGTRMLPAAKAVPKEMLPVLDRPTIQYVVEEAADAGSADVLLVVSGDKKAVEDHFDRHFELERRLAEKNRSDWIGSVTLLADRVRLHSTRQREQLGLGHAVLQAEHHVGDRPFLCLLGDTIFSGATPPARVLVEAHRRLSADGPCSVIGVERVDSDKVSRYGIVGGREMPDGVMRVDRFVEKPAPADAPSDLAIAARYLLSPTIFGVLHDTGRGAGGEIQLTDALQTLAGREPVYAVILDATRHDIGNPADWLLTNIHFARRDPALWAKVAPALGDV